MSVIADHLEAGRQRTLDLLAPFDDDYLVAQHSPIMSPLVWDLAHVGNYEDLWLVRALGGDPVGAQLDDLYDAFRHPRPERPTLPLLDPSGARAYLGEVRERALALLDGDAVRPTDPRLLDEGFVYGMVIQHEYQHDETMLATIQLSGADVADELRRHAPSPVLRGQRDVEVFVPGGPFLMGTSTEVWAYDNERPVHEVDVPPFCIDAAPVTNSAFAEFIADGGYDDERLWHPDGWRWRNEEVATGPLFWDGHGRVLRFGRHITIDG